MQNIPSMPFCATFPRGKRLGRFRPEVPADASRLNPMQKNYKSLEGNDMKSHDVHS